MDARLLRRTHRAHTRTTYETIIVAIAHFPGERSIHLGNMAMFAICLNQVTITTTTIIVTSQYGTRSNYHPSKQHHHHHHLLRQLKRQPRAEHVPVEPRHDHNVQLHYQYSKVAHLHAHSRIYSIISIFTTLFRAFYGRSNAIWKVLAAHETGRQGCGIWAPAN